MIIISKHKETGYSYVCDEVTSLCGFLNAEGEIVVPLEMEYMDRVWDYWSEDSTRARFVVFYKDGKAGFLFPSFLRGDACFKPRFDQWCYYRGVLSMRVGDRYYNLDNIAKDILVDVPYSWTSMSMKENDEKQGKVIDIEYTINSKSPYIFTLAPTYDDLILNQLFNGYELVEQDGKYNYKTQKGTLISEKWFDRATNFDEYSHAKFIYRDKEFLIEALYGECSIALLSKVESGEDLTDAFKDITELDEFFK